MKDDAQVKFTIIGLGNLMEVIWPCLETTLGGGDLAKRAVATTADSGDLTRKRQFFKIPVQLKGNVEALKKNCPEIIFFAPPPSAAPQEIEQGLKPYFKWAREQNKPLPEIYAFPPVPSGQQYREALGEDVLVSNIIPNNVHEIAGEAVIDEGYYACSFSGEWPDAQKDRLQRIFKTQGAMVEVPEEMLVPMLGGTCTFFALWQVVPELATILNDNGTTLTHNQVGQHMRAVCRGLSGYSDQQPPLPLAGDTAAAAFIEQVAIAWWRGVARYYTDISFPAKAAALIMGRGFDVILHTTQCEPVKTLRDHAVGAATKGGVLEKAIALFQHTVRPSLVEAAAVHRDGLPRQFSERLVDRVSAMAHEVGRHGQRLADGP
jgi:pyrroline-5-carboxylate reductase